MERNIAANNAAIAELRDEMARNEAKAVGTVGDASLRANATDARSHDQLVEEIKGQIQREMGLLPIRLLRERRASFVPVHAYDQSGALRYGTAGYLGAGYFITVKHGVVALDDSRGDRRITSVEIVHAGKKFKATVVDSGSADVEVHRGDWAILKVKGEIDLPPLHINVAYPYDFAEPIFRLGNDYSKGIIVSSGYVGQRMENGLVSCLTDGHPGVSGGGVLDSDGNLVGIPVGRMEGDYRFSFILPVRAEMFRKVPELAND
jgi:S1-C subfamily serine protease